MSHPQLLVRLALEGHAQAQKARDDRRQRRLTALRRHSGTFPGAYGEGYLSRLREEWPQ